ncbi:hypothetical protein cand_009180 [Cryptosporidium andersoni]|uniref:Uncharacterized protein n=1 Tax=Cryptosporidium andersoni TaxID=117008 RepID=A0A1J4MVI0_9CRYT|nr:hypothetical protein cand_009180 [Cryptosporidium andersoni]
MGIIEVSDEEETEKQVENVNTLNSRATNKRPLEYLSSRWSEIFKENSENIDNYSKRYRKRTSKNLKNLKRTTQDLPISNLGLDTLSIYNNIKEVMWEKRRLEWKFHFDRNRVFFESFPIYSKHLDPIYNGKQLDNKWHLQRNISSELFCKGSLLIGKKVCLIDNNHYIFHSKNQLYQKLRWYGAKVLTYYCSRADYVLYPSSFKELVLKVSNDDEFNLINYSSDQFMSYNMLNLRGLSHGQVKLSELEFLEFVNEDISLALETISQSAEYGSKLNVYEQIRDKIEKSNSNSKKMDDFRPRDIWELIGHKDSAEDLYKSLLNIRIQTESIDKLQSLGIDIHYEAYKDNYETICGVIVIIAPSNSGAQLCAEFSSFGCGYEPKVLRGSDVVDPFIRQWKKGHSLQLTKNLFSKFDEPPICTILSDCSSSIKSSDIQKLCILYSNFNNLNNKVSISQKVNNKDLYINKKYNSITKSSLENLDLFNTKVNESQCLVSSKCRYSNPGAFVIILEDTSEAGQMILNQCCYSNKCENSNNSYIIFNRTDNFRQSIRKSSSLSCMKVIYSHHFSKLSVACGLFNITKNLNLLFKLIDYYGANILKVTKTLQWIKLTDVKDVNIEKLFPTPYTPISTNAVVEIFFSLVQKHLFLLHITNPFIIRKEIFRLSTLEIYSNTNSINCNGDYTLQLAYEVFPFILYIIDKLLFGRKLDKTISITSNENKATQINKVNLASNLKISKIKYNQLEKSDIYQVNKIINKSPSDPSIHEYYLEDFNLYSENYLAKKYATLNTNSVEFGIDYSDDYLSQDEPKHSIKIYDGFNSLCTDYFTSNDSLSKLATLMDGLATFDSWYQYSKRSDIHFTNDINYYYINNNPKISTCEMFLTSIYLYAIMNSFNCIRLQNIPCNLPPSNKLFSYIMNKITKYSSIYSCNYKDSQFEKKSENASIWRNIEFSYIKWNKELHCLLPTWKSFVMDSNLVHLYQFRSTTFKNFDTISTIFSAKILRLNIKFTELPRVS